jgi:hypothetical protein
VHKGKCVQTITVQAVLCQTLLPIMSREAAVDPASGSSALEKWKMIEPGKGMIGSVAGNYSQPGDTCLKALPKP